MVLVDNGQSGCINLKALAEGRQIHAHIEKSGFKTNTRLWNILVDMYAKCGSLLEAREVFDKMPERNVVTWTMLIAGYAKLGQAEASLKLFLQMEQEGMNPDEVTFVSIVKACATLKALERGKHIHCKIIKSGITPNIFMGNVLIDLYVKCGSIKEARLVFDSMPKRDVISWTAMILGYTQIGHGEEAFNLFRQMELQRMKPNRITFVGVLKACTSVAVLREVHSSILENGFESAILVGNTLVDIYSKFDCLEDARDMFDKMISRDVVTWNIMISGYSQQNCDDEAFEVFLQMDGEAVQPDVVTFIGVLQACANQTSLVRGEWLHACIVRSGFELDKFVGSTLVDVYVKCENMDDAWKVFASLDKGDVVPWNAMIAGYAQHGHGVEAFKIFLQMQCEGVAANEVTLASVLKACGSLANFRQGKCLHAFILKTAFASNLIVGNTLVDMYAKCGSVEDGIEVFNTIFKRDAVSWNAMTAGYVQHGHVEDAFKMFEKMQTEGVKPNHVTFISMLKACTDLASFEQGKYIHALILKSGIRPNIIVGNTLVHMYAKCRRLEIAGEVFDSMPKRDAVSWAVMISSYTEHEWNEEAIKLYWKMEQEGKKPNDVAYIAVLRACASLAALEQGKRIHAQLVMSGLKLGFSIENALIEMYAKSGSLEDAQDVFHKMLERDGTSWSVMMLGYSQHGRGKEAVKFLERILLQDVKLDHVTFVGILSACSHAGLLCEGCYLFDIMVRNYGIALTTEHYACLVDLFGRVGHLEEAVIMVQIMPFQPSNVLWTALLNACRMHGNVNLAKRVVESILELEPENSGALVTLSNIYAAAGS